MTTTSPQNSRKSTTKASISDIQVPKIFTSARNFLGGKNFVLQIFNFLRVSDHFQQLSKNFQFFLLHLLTVAIASLVVFWRLSRIILRKMS